MSEYIVDFGDGAKSAVRMAMARQHGAEMRGGIVRCADCRWRKERKERDGMECRLRPLCNFYVKPDDFCSQGERRMGA